jgi:hypothetical protein
MQSLVFYLGFTFLTYYVALESDFKHMHRFNALVPEKGFQTAGQGIAWWTWCVFIAGHAVECIKALVCVPVSELPQYPYFR